MVIFILRSVFESSKFVMLPNLISDKVCFTNKPRHAETKVLFNMGKNFTINWEFNI